MAILSDGYQTTIALATNDITLIEEKETTPPAITGGGPIDLTSFSNTAVRTAAPKSLYSVGTLTVVASYDVGVYDQVLAAINSNQQITITFPDSSTLVVWGFLDEFTPGPNTEGGQPTATFVFAMTNRNASGTETIPNYTAST